MSSQACQAGVNHMRHGLIVAFILTCAYTVFIGSATRQDAGAAADTVVKVFVNGKEQSYNPPARIHNGVTYVPLRQGAQSLGFTCEWLAQENAAKICDDTQCFMIPKKDGLIVNGSLFLPLRKMAEAFKAKVTWDPTKKAVFIEKAKAKPKFE